MKKIAMLFLGLIAVILSGSVHAGTIKLAIVAPDGSAWANIMKEMGAELKQKTEGRWDITLYAGGVAGDEKVVVKKMKIGQLDAAALTGVGLGDIYPAIRVLELPFLFNNTQEVDYVVGKLLPEIKSGMSGKGYEFLGWAESGFVHIFSNKPIKGLGDMKGVKMWMWQGDPLAAKMYSTLEIVPVPLPLTDVTMALQTNMINGVYAPPLGAIAMQWFAKTKYMSDANLVNSIGALVMSKAAYDKMSPADQAILKQIADKYTKKLVTTTRSDNQKSIATLKSSGIEIVSVDGKNLDDLKAKSKTVWDSLAGSLYPKDLLSKTVGYVEEYRNKG